jgi:hypothetical protein
MRRARSHGGAPRAGAAPLGQLLRKGGEPLHHRRTLRDPRSHTCAIANLLEGAHAMFRHLPPGKRRPPASRTRIASRSAWSMAWRTPSSRSYPAAPSEPCSPAPGTGSSPAARRSPPPAPRRHHARASGRGEPFGEQIHQMRHHLHHRAPRGIDPDLGNPGDGGIEVPRQHRSALRHQPLDQLGERPRQRDDHQDAEQVESGVEAGDQSRRIVPAPGVQQLPLDARQSREEEKGDRPRPAG